MDNVPLLVSLFTDCTPASTRQMVEIMQEHGEVVAMLGSSANFQNIRSFLVADASLAVEPLYPQVIPCVIICLQKPFSNSKVCRRTPCCAPSSKAAGSPPLLPTALAQRLVGVACSLIFTREEDVSLYHAIIASRHHVLAIKYSLQFWISSCLFLSLLVFCTLLTTAPLPLSPPQALVLSSVYTPLLATCIFLGNHDKNIRSMSTGKNRDVKLSKATFCDACWSYGPRFLPSFFAILASHLLTVLNFCTKMDIETAEESQLCQEKFPQQLAFLQDVNMSFAMIALVLSSLTFISSTDHLWRYKVKRCWHLLTSSLLLLSGHMVFLLVQGFALTHPSPLPPESWALLATGVFVTVAVNELVKRHQIKANVRSQKRARLEFGTKLGINSPF